MIVTVSIGKGYKISSITDKNAKKYDFTAIGETVRSQALAVLQHKGRVYVLHDDARQVKGCCILRMEEHFTSEEHHITDKKALMMEYCSVLPDVDAEEFEKAVSAELMELLFYTDTAALQWGEKCITPEKMEHHFWTHPERWIAYLLLGIPIGIALDNVLVGICCGFLFAVAGCAGNYMIGNGKKKEK